MAKRIEHTGSIRATDDLGRSRTLHLYTEYADAGDSGGPLAIPVKLIIKTEEGQHVNRSDKGSYQIAATGENLRSNDPKAP
jgi:hypothetical protein